MTTTFKRLLFGALTLGALGFTSHEAHGRLPKLIQIHATGVYVDQETQTVVVKPGQPTKEPKPFVIDWNKEKDFIRNGAPATPTEIKQGASVVIHYTRVSFRNPLLKKVILENQTQHTQQP